MRTSIKAGIAAVMMALMFGAAGCDNNPVKRLVNPTTSNTANGSWSSTWTVYDDEVKTGGTIMSFTTVEGQDLDFSYHNNTARGSKCIKFSWSGSTVTAYSEGLPEDDYVGFSFIVAPSVDQYNSTTKDLTPGAFTTITFKARGSLNSNVVLRLESSNGISSTNAASDINAWESTYHPLTGDWQTFTFTVSGSQAAVKDFVKVILKSTASPYQSNGGVVYLDDIQLTQ